MFATCTCATDTIAHKSYKLIFSYAIEEIKHNILSFAEHLIVHKNAENAQKAVDVE